MESIISILERVESRAGLSRRGGHPLYAYRVDDATLAALREVLRGPAARGQDLDPFRCAGLCLFAAEYFCRTHDGGMWTWQIVRDALGFEGSWQELTRAIERGLRYWGRPLLQVGSSRQFLITMACEGGLPRKLLHREEQHLTRHLRLLLADHERYAHTPIAQLAERHEGVLPVSLRNDTVRELCCRLITEIARLRQVVGVAENLAALDARAPDWRQRLPLRLDDEVAQRLLGGLLEEPRPAAAPERGLLRLDVTLAEAPLRIVRRMRLPPEIDAAALAEMLGVAESAMPARMQLHVYSADGGPQAVANATSFDTGYRLVPQRRRGTAIESLGRLTLVASAGTHEIGRGEIEGGENLSGALPWVFADQDDVAAQPLVGMGSLRTQRERVRLLVPEGVELTPDEDAVVRELGAISQPAGRVVVLRGSARLIMEGELYRVTTRAPEDTARRYLLRGRHENLGVGGSEVWYGLPRVFSVVDEEMPVEVARAQVKWRYAWNATGWQGGERSPTGDVVLRVIEDGETRFRAHLSVVPRGFRCLLLPGNQARSGTIRLEQTGAVDLSHEAPEGVACEVERAGAGGFEVRVSTQSVPPAVLRIGLMFQDRGEVRLAVPFPSAVPVFVDRAGQLLPDDAEVPLRQLVGAFAVVHAPRPRSKFRLRGRLNWGGPGWVELADLVAGQGETAVSLDGVRDQVDNLLASTDALDAYVELRLIEIGASSGRAVQIRVRHYDAALSRNDMEGGSAVELFLDAPGLNALGPAQVAALCVEARPIDAPGEEPVALPAIDSGRWRFDMGERAPGGWLVTGRIETMMALRPILITVRDEYSDDEGAGDMVKAVRFHRREERKEALHAVVNALGKDFGHPDWALMMDYLKTLKTLPASTFDPVKAMARVPDAAVKALFLAGLEEFDIIWDGLEDMPFLWKVVPARSWIRAAYHYRDYLSAVLGQGAPGLDPARLVGEAIHRVLTRAAQRSLHMGWLHFALWQKLGNELPGLAMPTMTGGQRAQARQSLLRQSGRWPEWNHRVELDILLDEYGVPGSMRDNDLRHRHGVLNAPVLAAAAAVHGHEVDDHLIFELRRMRAFDEDWFEHAHAQAFLHILDLCNREDPEFLQ